MYGGNNGCGILAKEIMGKLLKNQELTLPGAKQLKDQNYKIGTIFLLKTWLIKPHVEEVNGNRPLAIITQGENELLKASLCQMDDISHKSLHNR